MKAYSEMYIYDAVRCMAEMMEYAVNECGVEAKTFFDTFIGLGYADAFGNGNLKYVAGTSGVELAQKVIVEGRLSTNPESDVWDESIYWCGWILAYYQWVTSIPFRNIVECLTFDYLRITYPALHTASEEKAVEIFNKKMKSHQSESRVKQARLNYGYSQSELAKVAEINLRTLQEYESRRRNINLASGSVLIKIARALCCNIEDIMEFEL